MVYYVMTPFEPVCEEEFLRRREEFVRNNQKCMGIVFNCENYEDFCRKWFGED